MKIHPAFSLALLILLCLCEASIAKAQGQYRLISFSADFPMKIVPRSVLYAKGATIFIDNSYFEIKHPEFYKTSRVLDTLFFEFVSTDASIPVIWYVHCIVDTVDHQLKEVYASYYHGWGSSGGQYPYTYSESFNEKCSVLFSAFPYQQVGNDLLVINDSGSHCKESIRKVSYELRKDISGYYDPRNPPETFDDISSTLSDTLPSFNCSMVLSTKMLSVIGLNDNSKNQLIAQRSIDGNAMLFTFPEIEHPERITIYDILGRKITELEVNTGATEYLLPASRFKKGCYFAQLGPFTAHF